MPPTPGTSTPSSNVLWMPCNVPRRPERDHPLRRRTPSRGPLPPAAPAARHPLLDEPTNHLDAESIDWLEQHLQQYPGTVIAITHDRYFLDHVAGWILELDRGGRNSLERQLLFTARPEDQAHGPGRKSRQASAARPSNANSNGYAWPQGSSGQGKARLSSYDRLLNEDQKEREERLEIFIHNGPRLGSKVIDVQGFESLRQEAAVQRPELRSPRAALGVIGPNGAGKTTLFPLIMGQETPDAGSFEVGETVKIAYVDQTHHDLLPEKKSVYEVISWEWKASAWVAATSTPAPTCRASTSPEPTRKRKSECFRRAYQPPRTSLGCGSKRGRCAGWWTAICRSSARSA